MLGNKTSLEKYFELNQSLEKQNEEYMALLNTGEYKTGSFIKKLTRCVKTGNWKSVRGYFRNRRWNKKMQSAESCRPNRRAFQAEDYASNERIAVYTCVFGKYDQLQEPVFQPDNIDYYIITDQPVPENSRWQPIEWASLCPAHFSNSEKNRYFKMHPDVVFPSYPYSVYIDGNIRVISDLTPYIGLLGDCGIGFHYHNQRVCAYQELEAIQLAHKASAADANAYADYLRAQGFPERYGLLECNVIVRAHHNPVCRRVMEGWWAQYREHVKRDQVSLPFVLYQNDVKVDDVAVLGNDVYRNYSFRIVKHS